MPSRLNASLIERAAELYGFEAELFERGRAPTPTPKPVEPEEAPPPNAEAWPPLGAAPARILPADDILDLDEGLVADDPWFGPVDAESAPALPPSAARDETVAIDRAALAEAGFIVPGGPATGLAEEYRIIKRPLLAAIGRGELPHDKARSILVTSAASGDGKSFSALNLALSLAGEEGIQVLLIDGDVVKPGLPDLLGIVAGAGLVDALLNPDIDPETLVVQSGIEALSFLPAGRRSHDVTELLSSARTAALLAGLVVAAPRRILVIDSPPVLMASPAAALAAHVGQTVMVVRADATTETDLQEAVGLMSACDHLSLLLNAADANATGRRYGSYHGLDVR